MRATPVTAPCCTHHCTRRLFLASSSSNPLAASNGAGAAPCVAAVGAPSRTAVVRVATGAVAAAGVRVLLRPVGSQEPPPNVQEPGCCCCCCCCRQRRGRGRGGQRGRVGRGKRSSRRCGRRSSSHRDARLRGLRQRSGIRRARAEAAQRLSIHPPHRTRSTAEAESRNGRGSSSAHIRLRSDGRSSVAVFLLRPSGCDGPRGTVPAELGLPAPGFLFIGPFRGQGARDSAAAVLRGAVQ